MRPVLVCARLRNLGRVRGGFRLLLRRVTSGMVWCDPFCVIMGHVRRGVCLLLRREWGFAFGVPVFCVIGIVCGGLCLLLRRGRGG